MPEGGIGTEQQEVGTSKRVSHILRGRVQRTRHASRPQEGSGDHRNDSAMDKQQLQFFLGIVNYMGTFIPNLSHHTEPLWAMLKKDNMFHLGRSTNSVLSASQDPNCESQHHTAEILRQESTRNSTSGCFSQGAGSLPHTETQRKGPADRLCQQESHGCRDKVCQHREGTSSHCLCLPTFQHLSTRKELRSRE